MKIDKGIRSDIWQDDIRGSMELCWQLCREKLLNELLDEWLISKSKASFAEYLKLKERENDRRIHSDQARPRQGGD